MAWKSKRKARPWRKYLTAAEAAEIAKMDRLRAEIQAKQKLLRAGWTAIQNRATKRAQYAGEAVR